MRSQVVLTAGAVIGVDVVPDGIIDFALAERCEPYPEGATKPQEMVMIETALIRFRGDKAKAARQIGWTPNGTFKTKFWRLRFATGWVTWRAAA